MSCSDRCEEIRKRDSNSFERKLAVVSFVKNREAVAAAGKTRR